MVKLVSLLVLAEWMIIFEYTVARIDLHICNSTATENNVHEEFCGLIASKPFSSCTQKPHSKIHLFLFRELVLIFYHPNQQKKWV